MAGALPVVLLAMATLQLGFVGAGRGPSSVMNEFLNTWK